MELEAGLQRFGLSGAQVQDFKGFFNLRHYQPGESIFAQGDVAETFCLIHSGELLVTQRTTYGGERTLSVRKPGEVFGEIGLLEDLPRTATVTALTHVQLFETGKRQFHALIEANASFHQFLQRLHANRLLSSVPLFGGLSAEMLEKIQMSIRQRNVRAGDVLAAAVRDHRLADQRAATRTGDRAQFSAWRVSLSQPAEGGYQPGEHAVRR